MKPTRTHILIAAALVGALALTTTVAHAADKPNILVILTDNLGYGEIDIGTSDKGRTLVVFYTERGSNIRIVSCRKATPPERKLYEEAND